MSQGPNINAAQTLAHIAITETKNGVVDQHQVIRQCYLFHIGFDELHKQMDNEIGFRFHRQINGSYKIEKLTTT